jgi:paraquat-inducible protein A
LVVVLFVTALAPLIRLIGTLYVLIRAHEAMPPRHLRRVFALAEKLRPCCGSRQSFTNT